MGWGSGTFTRTNGVYSGNSVWAQDEGAGVDITSSRHDTHDLDLANGINQCVNKDGSNAANVVTTSWLASNAVTTAKITDANVTTSKIANTSITNSKMGVTWSSWTPTVTPAGLMTYTSTTILGRYSSMNKIVLWEAYIQGTVGGTPSSTFTMSLPATAADSNYHVANGIVSEVGVGVTGACGYPSSTTQMTIQRYDNSNFGLAVVIFRLSGMFESA